MFLDSAPSDELLLAFRRWVFARWADKLEAVGKSLEKNGERWNIRPSEAHGIDLQRVDDHGRIIALYLSKIQDDHTDHSHKWHVAGEMSRFDVKNGQKTGDGDVHINPFQLLDDDCPLALDEASRSAKWIEFVSATKGRRAILWTRGLKAMFGIDDLSDEDIIDDETNHAVATWKAEPDSYSEVYRKRPELLGVAKLAAEHEDWRTVASILPGHLSVSLDDTGLAEIAFDGAREARLNAINRLDERWRQAMHNAVRKTSTKASSAIHRIPRRLARPRGV